MVFGFFSSPAPAPPPPPEKPKVRQARSAGRTGPLFCSSKAPPEPGLSCELPFGLVISPTQVDSSVTKVDGLPPVVCLTCLSYLNPFCKVTKLGWNCALCGEDNYLPKDVDVAALMENHSVEYQQDIPVEEKEEDVCNYILVVDANLPNSDAQAIVSALQDHLDASLDSTLKTTKIQKKLEQRRQELESRHYIVDAEDAIASLETCLKAAIPKDSTKSFSSRKEMLKQKKQERLQEENVSQVANTSLWTRKPKALRNTGDAIQCAVDLASVGETAARTSRILLFTNGCPSVGEGSVVEENSKQVDAKLLVKSVAFFDEMGTVSLEAGISFDVFCSGE